MRALQVDDTLAILAADPAADRQLLVGDLNAPHEAPELAKLWTRLSDSWIAAPRTSGGPSTYPATTPVKRIDFVTVGSGIRVQHAAVPDAPGATEASDHRPVVADLFLQA